MDYSCTCKLLHRLSKRYLLDVKERLTRLSGGYENLYAISARGWSRISYLTSQNMGQAPAIPTLAGRNLMGRMYAANYLLNGKGKFDETIYSACAVAFNDGPVEPPVTDEVGHLLICLDEKGFLGRELSCRLLSQRPQEQPDYRTYLQATRLQELEYIPPDIDLTVYIPNARALGSSDLAILLGLVIREIHKLRLEKIEHELGDSKDSRSEASIRATEDDLSHHRLEEAYLESRLINSEARSEIRARIIDDDNMFLLKLSDVLGTIVAQEDKTGLRLGFRDAMDELHRGAPTEKALQRLSKSHRERTITETPLQKLRLIILQKVLNSTKEGNRLDYAYLENEASILHSRYSS